MGDYNIGPKYHVNDVRFLYQAVGSVTVHSADINTGIRVAIPLLNWMRPDRFNTAISTAICYSVGSNLLSLSLGAPLGGEVGAPTDGQPYVVLIYDWLADSTPGDAVVNLNLYFTDPWVLPTLNILQLGAM